MLKDEQPFISVVNLIEIDIPSKVNKVHLDFEL